MKLLLTLDFPPERGGIQKYLFEKAAHSFHAGDRIMVGARRRAGSSFPALPCKVTRHANMLSRIDKKWSLVNLMVGLFFVKQWRSGTFEIECGNVYAGIVPWFFSLFGKTRYRIYTHGTELLGLHKISLRSWLLKSVLRKATGLYATGNYVAGLLQQAGVTTTVSIDPPRITLPATPVRHERFGRGTETIRLLSVGRFVPHKGHAVLITACSALPAALSWRLVLAGDGPEEHRLLRLIDRYDLADRISLKKDLDDSGIAAEYRAADLFVLPSLETAHGTEGFGIVLLEAMAAGVPVLASKVGGVPEVLDHGACGILVDPGNAAALTEAITHLITTDETRERLSAAALERVRDRYAW